MTTRPFLLALAIDGLGEPHGPTSLGDLVDTVAAAESGGFMLLTAGDPVSAEAASGETAGTGLSSTEIVSYLARRTSHIALLATATSHYTEPFFTAKAIATLDFISGGRAGVIIDPSVNALADERFPGLPALAPAELLDQAAEFGTVLRELWDSWEDNATIREVSTGRYVDNSKIHHIDHNGPYFTVKGPLITPRPPQGQPPVAVRLDGSAESITLAAAIADIVFVPAMEPAALAVAVPVGSADAVEGLAAIAATVAQLAAEASSMGRSRSSLTILAGVTVTDEDAAAVITRLRGIAGLDGVELRAEPANLRAVVAAVAVVVQDVAVQDVAVQDVAAEGGPAGSASLRDRLGLDRPLSRYATAD